MSKYRFYYISFLLVLSLFSCTAPPTPLRIATAANMQYVMPELIKAFSQQTGIHCEAIFSSSGKLTAQIQAGAPYDVFVSADLKFPNALYQNGLLTAPPRVYAQGNLVLWTTSLTDALSLQQLTKVQHIALANPRTAPYGRAAMEVLQKVKLADTLQAKLVFGESIAQTNQFITTGAAEVGFTAKSVVLAPHLRDKGRWVAIDNQFYQPIQQGVGVIKNSPRTIQGEQFMDFLQSKTASEILHTFGYDSPTQSMH